MVPTLPGRIQTRIFLLATVGVIVTALLTPLLPLLWPLSTAYKTTYIILATVLVLGIAWECLYHLLMQWRWEKDWPSLFGLVTAVPEEDSAAFSSRGSAAPPASAPPRRCPRT